MGVDPTGISIDTLTIEWIDDATPTPHQPIKGNPDPWRRKSLRMLRQALMNVLVDHGKEMRPWANGALVRAVDIEIIRPEFYHGYPAAEATDAKGKQGARQRAFHRAINDAKAANLIGSWEIENVTYVWLITPHQAQEEMPVRSSVQTDEGEEAEPAEPPYEVLGPAAAEAPCTLCGKTGDVMRIRYRRGVRAWHEGCARKHLEETSGEPQP